MLIVLRGNEHRVRFDSGTQRLAPVRKDGLFRQAVPCGKGNSTRFARFRDGGNLELIRRIERVGRVGVHAARTRADDD